MRKLFYAILLAGLFSYAGALRAQQVCPGFTIVVNTPEDELMLAVNGADTPQEQVAALDTFSKEHADSKFMPCVYEYYTLAYLKLNDFDKVIEYGQKGLEGGYQDVMLMMNLTKGFVASGKVGDVAFDVIMKAPEQIKAESTSARPPSVSDADWQKALEEAAEQAKEQRAYMEYAFFQLLPRVPDAAQRLAVLDLFVQAYPESPNAGQTNFQYFIASKMANNIEKADEYGEKAIVADPENVVTLNLVADHYATRQVNLDKAAEYATKALALAPNMKKPEGVTDEQFKPALDGQLGLAYATLGYIEFLKAAKTRKVVPAIQQFTKAIDLLGGNAELLGRTLYFLGYAYEVMTPANHRAAADALTRAASVPSAWQSQAQDLLTKVKRAMAQ